MPPSVPAERGDRPLILVMGLMQRTGTELLRALLLAHPACANPWPGTGNEDWLVSESGHLVSYARAVASRWKPDLRPGAETELLGALGSGLVARLGALADTSGDGPPGRTPVIKTPSVRGIGRVPVLFPTARCVVVVRDARDAVESAVRTFGWSHAGAMRRWAAGARELLELGDPFDSGPDRWWTVVRFEDLASDAPSVVPGILRFCGLDPGAYDEAAYRQPVRGSSDLRLTEGDVDWRPRQLPEGFRPTGRWASWGPAERARFRAVVGDLNRRLGYGELPGTEPVLTRLGARLDAAVRPRLAGAADALSPLAPALRRRVDERRRRAAIRGVASRRSGAGGPGVT